MTGNLTRSRTALLAAIAVCTLLLPACGSSRMTTGAALAPGESASLRLTGRPASVELYNIGRQDIQYRVDEDGITGEQGTLGPGDRIAESRDADELLITITNPGPHPAQARFESRSRGGMEFTQPARGN